ncbi:hypothetical protein SAMN04488057_1125 [Cyclobacterium lianum]|uniref:Uncharacterized protein n=1 Tax=Cyclobacterium lianum TaxID=388280 RepID=A0A1M7PYG8_9BACT|nr:hypothetical protein [Cyclobacterium lianum]SHN22726.1 hypothetical protein SAMN04488057_1125 [Cyclobacterium lianum]
MSTKNSISIQIPEEELTAIRDALNTLKTTLGPYLVALSPSERQTIPKMGDGTAPFGKGDGICAELRTVFTPFSGFAGNGQGLDTL